LAAVIAAVIVTQIAATAVTPATGGAVSGSSNSRPKSPSEGGGGVPVGRESKAKPKTRKQVKTKAKAPTIKKPRIKFRRSK
jgi:hypothetical protein